MAVGVVMRARAAAAGGGPLGGQRLSRSLSDARRRHTVPTVAHRLGGQVAVVHALCAVLARRATILVDTLSLALATAHAGAASPKGRRADGRHGGCERNRNVAVKRGRLRCVDGADDDDGDDDDDTFVMDDEEDENNWK